MAQIEIVTDLTSSQFRCYLELVFVATGEPSTRRALPWYTEKYNLYLPSAVFIAQVLVGPSKQLKQIIQT